MPSDGLRLKFNSPHPSVTRTTREQYIDRCAADGKVAEPIVADRLQQCAERAMNIRILCATYYWNQLGRPSIKARGAVYRQMVALEAELDAIFAELRLYDVQPVSASEALCNQEDIARYPVKKYTAPPETPEGKCSRCGWQDELDKLKLYNGSSLCGACYSDDTDRGAYWALSYKETPED